MPPPETSSGLLGVSILICFVRLTNKAHQSNLRTSQHKETSMTELPFFHTAETILDEVPECLPITCLRKDPISNTWVLKTANENGVKQTTFAEADDLDAIERALRSYRNLPRLAVGPIVLCFDHQTYFGLESRLARIFPEGRQQRAFEVITFPWSTEPKT